MCTFSGVFVWIQSYVFRHIRDPTTKLIKHLLNTSLVHFSPELVQVPRSTYPFVDENKLMWAEVTGMTIDYMEPPLPKPERERYLFLRETGIGKNGPVSLAVDKKGKACVLKFYLHDINGEKDFAEQDRNKVCKENLEKTKAMVAEEVHRWHTLQVKYREHAAPLVLNQQSVLRMPVGAPVPVASRLEVLGDVKTKLDEFVCLQRGMSDVVKEEILHMAWKL